MKIWADGDGESHIERVSLGARWAPAERGVAALGSSEPLQVDRVHFVTVGEEGRRPDWHRGPRRQLVVFLDGWVRLSTSDGDHVRLRAGSVALIEDLHGVGHLTEHEPGERRVLVIPLDPEGR